MGISGEPSGSLHVKRMARLFIALSITLAT